MDQAAARFSVGLSFGGIPSVLTVPFRALTGFADPHVRLGLRFRPAVEPTAAPELPAPESEPAPPAEKPQVVSLDAFRRRSPPKE